MLTRYYFVSFVPNSHYATLRLWFSNAFIILFPNFAIASHKCIWPRTISKNTTLWCKRMCEKYDVHKFPSKQKINISLKEKKTTQTRNQHEILKWKHIMLSPSTTHFSYTRINKFFPGRGISKEICTTMNLVSSKIHKWIWLNYTNHKITLLNLLYSKSRKILQCFFINLYMWTNEVITAISLSCSTIRRTS